MVIRTIKKQKDNLPYQRQSVVGHYCIAKCAAQGGDRKLGGVIKSEKRDDNGKKIAYQVELFGEVSKPLRVISCSDVKHLLNDAAVEEFVRERVNSSRPAIRSNAEAFRKEWRNGTSTRVYGGFSKN